MKGNVNVTTRKTSKYTPLKILGEGSHGKAFLVLENATNTKKVIKTIPIYNLTSQEKKEAVTESSILRKLDHPNIIKFSDVFVSKKPNQILHIVMDYADGGDLFKRIQRNKTLSKYIRETEVLDIFTQVCLAVKHIHDRKVIHRDIKSQNIFLTKKGIAKLGDFGIAKCLKFTLDKLNEGLIGTPYYLSPEVIQNKPYSFKSDIWALGVLLYELCCLQMPFDAKSIPLLSLKIMKGVYNPIPISYSRELRLLISSLLNLDEYKRPSINEILNLPIIKNRIKLFLNEIEFNDEFSHTIIHNFNLLKLKEKNKEEERHRDEGNGETFNSDIPFIKIEDQKTVISNFKETNINTAQFQKANSEGFGEVTQKQQTCSKTKDPKEKDFYVIKKTISENVLESSEAKSSSDYIQDKQEPREIKAVPNTHRIQKAKANTFQQNIKVVNSKIQPEKVNIPLFPSKKLSFNKLFEESNTKTSVSSSATNTTNSNSLTNNSNSNSTESANNKVVNLNGGGHFRSSDENTNGVSEIEKKYKSNTNLPYPQVIDCINQRDVSSISNQTIDDWDIFDISKMKISSNDEHDLDELNKEQGSDCLDRHKMCVELKNIQTEKCLENDVEKLENDFLEEDVNEVEPEEDFTFFKEEEIECVNSPQYQSIQNNKSVLLLREYNSDYDQLESIKVEIEREIGVESLTFIYKTINENTDKSQYFCDLKRLESLVSKEIMKTKANIKFSEKSIEKILSKIPEIYSIVLKEREQFYLR